MGKVGLFMLRKILYVGLSAGTLAAGAYLHMLPDPTNWKLHDILIAAGTAAWGGIFSGVLGGSLSKKP